MKSPKIHHVLVYRQGRYSRVVDLGIHSRRRRNRLETRLKNARNVDKNTVF